MRDLPGFVQTADPSAAALQLLTLKPTNRNNWFSFALAAAHYLAEAVRPGRQHNRVVYEATLEGSPENDYIHGAAAGPGGSP